MDSVAINYVGGEEILTHPLYLKWSQLTFENVMGAAPALINDLKLVQANMDNLAIISYLATLLRTIAYLG